MVYPKLLTNRGTHILAVIFCYIFVDLPTRVDATFYFRPLKNETLAFRLSPKSLNPHSGYFI